MCIERARVQMRPIGGVMTGSRSGKAGKLDNVMNYGTNGLVLGPLFMARASRCGDTASQQGEDDGKLVVRIVVSAACSEDHCHRHQQKQ